MTRRFARGQQGVVLLIAMIMLVAMSLAGVALMRSVDTATVVAGNFAFKEAAVQVADRGTQAAVAWLQANSAGVTLQNTNSAAGYFSNRPSPEPKWEKEEAWDDAVKVNGGTPDAAGNSVRYVIHRMCTQPDAAHGGIAAGVTNFCATYEERSAAASGGSMAVGATQFTTSPSAYYRITTRVDGPRNTISIIQTSVLVRV